MPSRPCSRLRMRAKSGSAIRPGAAGVCAPSYHFCVFEPGNPGEPGKDPPCFQLWWSSGAGVEAQRRVLAHSVARCHGHASSAQRRRRQRQNGQNGQNGKTFEAARTCKRGSGGYQAGKPVIGQETVPAALLRAAPYKPRSTAVRHDGMKEQKVGPK